MDGYRLCHLLRAESRSLFRNLPIFLILDHPPTEADRSPLAEVDGDGFIDADASIHTPAPALGPLLDGSAAPRARPRAALLAMGLGTPTRTGSRRWCEHLGFELQTGPPQGPGGGW